MTRWYFKPHILMIPDGDKPDKNSQQQSSWGEDGNDDNGAANNSVEGDKLVNFGTSVWNWKSGFQWVPPPKKRKEKLKGMIFLCGEDFILLFVTSVAHMESAENTKTLPNWVVRDCIMLALCMPPARKYKPKIQVKIQIFVQMLKLGCPWIYNVGRMNATQPKITLNTKRLVQGGRNCAGARVAPAEKFGLGRKF